MNLAFPTNLDEMHKAARATIEKNFGIENGNNKNWPIEKKRAYGGLYRYKALTLVQRQENWQAAAQQLRQGMQVDQSLAIDLDLFYDLALGSQPVGFRGTDQGLVLSKNADLIQCMLADVFTSSEGLRKVRQSAYATAYYALGLVAYNTGKPNLCRKYLLRAVSYQPALIYDFRLMGDLLKSNINPALIKRLRRLNGGGFKSIEKIINKPKA